MRTNGGKRCDTVIRSVASAAARRVSCSELLSKRPSLTPAASQPSARTTTRRGTVGNSSASSSACTTRPPMLTRCTPGASGSCNCSAMRATESAARSSTVTRSMTHCCPACGMPSTTLACACTSICTSSRSPLTITVAITASTQSGVHFAGALRRFFISARIEESGACACTRGAKLDANIASRRPAAAAERHGGRRQFVGTP